MGGRHSFLPSFLRSFLLYDHNTERRRNRSKASFEATATNQPTSFYLLLRIQCFWPSHLSPDILTLPREIRTFPLYLLLKYQAKAFPPVTSLNGVGTSAMPGRATGCLRYTAAQMFWLTSKKGGMNAKADMYGRGVQGVA